MAQYEIAYHSRPAPRAVTVLVITDSTVRCLVDRWLLSRRSQHADHRDSDLDSDHA